MNLQDISILSIDRVIPKVSSEQFKTALKRFEESGMLSKDVALEKGIVRMEYKGEYNLKLCFRMHLRIRYLSFEYSSNFVWI